ncbi:MAG TPA: ABC transporter permease [Blastocatellia bacterium]|nr:ABC transporter permease [Blastocatellia bacterium]
MGKLSKRIKIGFRSIFVKPKVERELDKELQFHLELEIEKNMRRGMNPEEARRLAVRSFGGFDQVKEQCREARGTIMIDNLLQDIRYGLRVMAKNPGFSCMAILTLALGIGANTSIFSVIYGVLMRPLPYQQGSQLVIIHQAEPLAHQQDIGFSAKEVFDYRDMNHTLSGVVEHHSMSFILYGKDEPERVKTAVVSANFFDVLGVKPLMGRAFVPSDDVRGANAVLMLSFNYWKESFGGDPNIVGKIFEMNDRPHTVIGVLPPIPQYPVENDVYMPTSCCPTRSSDRFIANRNFRMMTVFGRLKPGVQLDQARADLSTIASHLQQEYPDSYPKSTGYNAVVTPLQEDLTSQAKPTLLILLGTSLLVLLLACANVANLSLARLMRRQREMAVRTALGAGRGRLIRQLLTESMMLSIIGGILGLLLASSGMKLLVTFVARFTTRASEIKLDGSVLAFTLIVSVLTGLVFGLVPAFSTEKNLPSSLREGGKGAGQGAVKQKLRGLLIVAQVAISCMLLIGSGLMLRSLIKLQSVNGGFNTDRVMVMRLAPNFSKYTTPQDYRNYFQRVLDTARSQPGVQSVSLASNFPFSPNGLTFGPNTNGFEIEGQPVPNGALPPQSDTTVVTPDYLQTLRIPLIRGRFFTDDDKPDGLQVAVINQTLANHRFGNEDPIGKHIRFLNPGGQPNDWITIVGVVGDIRDYGLDHAPIDEIYGPLTQNNFAGNLIVRTGGEPMAMANTMRRAIHDVDNQTAIVGVKTLEEFKDDSLVNPRVTTILLGIFAGLAILITAAGIAGVMALSVSQRTHELGVRMALGASQSGVLLMVLRQGMILVGIGLVIGVVGGFCLTGMMSSLLFAITPTDPVTFLTVSVVLTVVAIIAAFVPARRITGIDPIIALRSE